MSRRRCGISAGDDLGAPPQMASHDRRGPASCRNDRLDPGTACRGREPGASPRWSARQYSDGSLLKLSQSTAFSAKHRLTSLGPARKPPPRSNFVSPRPSYGSLGWAAIEAPEEVTPMSDLPLVSRSHVSQKHAGSVVADPSSCSAITAAADQRTARRVHPPRRKLPS